jgi:hypothetical protein
MKFMIMVFGDEANLHAKPPEWAASMTAFMARLDDELAVSGELVFSEVLEDGHDATLVDRHRGVHRGSIAGRGSPLSRFWVVSVADERRALDIAGSIAEVIGGAVEVREIRQGSQRP